MDSQSKTHAALFLVGLASYAILRKGSRSRKAKEKEVISGQPPLPELKPTKIPEQRPIAPTDEKICDENIQDRSEDILALTKNIEGSSDQEQDAVAQVVNNHEDTKVSSHEVESHNNLNARQTILGRIVECANCERIIGKLEYSYNYNGNILCLKCYQLLISEDN